MKFVTQVSAMSTCQDQRRVDQIVRTVSWSSQYKWMKEYADLKQKEVRAEQRLNTFLVVLLVVSVFFNVLLYRRSTGTNSQPVASPKTGETHPSSTPILPPEVSPH